MDERELAGGCVVARRRLRHKLMLGLALVASSIMLLAGGAGYGFYAHYIGNKINNKKLTELETINQGVIGAINNLEPIDPDEKHTPYLLQITLVRQYLQQYRKTNEQTVAAGHDPDNGEDERWHIARMEAQIDKLEDAVQRLKQPITADNANRVQEARLETIRQAHRDLRLEAEGLRLAIVTDIQKNGQHSEAAIRQSLWLAGFALVWSILLVGTMLYYFRAWMFTPIRELQAGVQRVHAGNFSQPITLTSGDELQELADEFNTMVARLHAVYSDLNRQVNERSRQLVRSERMVSVGFLAAGVAHEINNPLASILFCAEALERRLQDVLTATNSGTAAGSPQSADTEVLTRYLKMIQQEALRCKGITQKLLEFSRSPERRKESADLTGLIRDVLEMAKYLPSSRGKLVAFEPTGYVVAPVNAQDLKSVILNLVVNALDRMEDGGRLAISLGTSAGYAEMVFTDTGCGMTPEVLQNIFEPFFTKSRTGKGTGLGLFISHQIVDQHGGTITAQSVGPGCGSTFTVRIPLELRQGVPQDDPEPNVLPFPGGNREAA
jgi:signal transduction histidine kinase